MSEYWKDKITDILGRAAGCVILGAILAKPFGVMRTCVLAVSPPWLFGVIVTLSSMFDLPATRIKTICQNAV